ncbi:30S ribosomal protein S13 [Candidatus Pacearchaeota archaeon]|nr:30S ribosomal protein S13 [Candidatus Pacearchaeota archaeon]
METKTNIKKQDYGEKVVRILSKDIEGGMKIYPGLTKIKGISWSASNAICKALSIDKNRKIGSLSPEEIKKLSEFIKNPKLPRHIYNRKKDFETGEDKYFVGSDLELRTEFDIKRLKKIKSYRGLRHSLGLPLRGQRTKSHFRKNRKKGSGMKVKEKPKLGANEKKI